MGLNPHVAAPAQRSWMEGCRSGSQRRREVPHRRPGTRQISERIL